MPSGIVIAGTHSGVGKTTITLALLAALRRRGMTVAPFKVGPDFIDPGHHRAAAGRDSRNLDGWMLGRETCCEIFARATAGTDFAVVEGVMGLFDGAVGDRDDGSTAEMAKWLKLPVVLIVDADAMARSAAAVVKGFKEFDPALRVAGVIFNRIGGAGHLEYLREAMGAVEGVEILGGLIRDEQIHTPERHLGLITVEERTPGPDMLARLANWFEAGVNLDRLTGIAAEVVSPDRDDAAAGAANIAGNIRPISPAINIAVARDEAFCFYYPENLELLERLGARITAFSPLRDHSLPDRSDLIYLGGGYPELHAAALSANGRMREAIAAHAKRGGFVYAECGGFMYLCESLIDVEHNAHQMCGVFPLTTRMNSRLNMLGYREVEALAGNPLFEVGSRLRGHVFHFSSLEAPAPEHAAVPHSYKISTARGPSSEIDGYCRDGRVLGGYLHLHFLSNRLALAGALQRISAAKPL
jgi:cobyrinic acid a,c-diamide synthase